MDMVRNLVGIKLMVALSVLGGVIVATRAPATPQRTKKQNMVEMGQQFEVLERKMVVGSVSAKFADQDFQELVAACESLTRLAKEYDQLESNKEVSAISTRLGGTLEYLKQQAQGKDPLITVMSYGQVLSYCAECHYQTRWSGPPGK
jgi:hypothetical protein